MSRLNYKHLYYFYEVAKNGNLTKTAELLHLSQSALSMQIKQLEERLGQVLFNRQNRTLVLTEAGKVTLRYAENIFSQGDELQSILQRNFNNMAESLHIGATTTLSRNFQEAFLKPIFSTNEVALTLVTGKTGALLKDLEEHQLDVVLSNTPVSIDETKPFRCQLISQQTVSVIGKPCSPDRQPSFPHSLAEIPLIVPGKHSNIRSGIDSYFQQHQIKPNIRAEVDDMAMMRLLARDMDVLAILPPVVVRDELRAGLLVEHYQFENIVENFYATTIDREFQSPVLKQLIQKLPKLMYRNKL